MSGDWSARWRALHAAASRDERQVDDRWRERAARFDRLARTGDPEGLDALGAGLLATDALLDVGAGTGRHAVPLAARCARVVAVEPSRAMRERLMARVAEARAPVQIVEGTWPCEVERVDVAISCHVLYGVADAAPFLSAMTAATRRTCRLLLGLRAPTDALAPLWRALHGVDRPLRPAAREAQALLLHLGHPATLRVLPSDRRLSFERSPEDLDELCRRTRVDATAEGRARVTAALDALGAERSREGGWDLGPTGDTALIEWPGAG
ncbi:MAG: class I SAM-dependent methyltransferase [Polyangiaceae bacterium]|nr:class I SAM-dependent methyltransferase [Polyangiaceae bacterium]